MDPYTEQLIERTRQRRAMLNQKMGKTPDPAPRKRVLEDSTNQPAKLPNVDDDSPKRHCGSDREEPGSSSNKGVSSRMKALTDERMNWSDVKEDQQENRPSSKRFEGNTSPVHSPQSRKSRFAQLAQNLDNFECDMSHPTVKKQEEKKPRWQPPKRDDSSGPSRDARDRHVSSPRKEYESYQGPTRPRGAGGAAPSATAVATSLQASPKKHQAPAPPTAPPLPEASVPPQKPPRSVSPQRALSPGRGHVTSPKVSKHTVNLQQPQTNSPKYTHPVRQVTNQVPVNKRPDSTDSDEPTQKSVNERLNTWKKTDTPSKKPSAADPTELPLSERFAGWEQRIAQTPKSDSTPARKINPTPNKFTTPSQAQGPSCNPDARSEVEDPSSKPVSDIRASWKQQEEQNIPRKNEEPTAYSVGDRMSAWENLTSANKVSYTKKVDPSSPSNTPGKSVQNLRPTGTPNKGSAWKPPAGQSRGLTPQKSFKESIEERAAQLGRGQAQGANSNNGNGLPPKAPTLTRTPSKTTGSPQKTVPSPKAASPTNKVGSATKSLQQKILQQVQCSKTDKLAEKIRQERMAEVNTLNNRYQNGILKDDRTLDSTESESESAAPPPAQAVPSQDPRGGNKKEAIRAKARQDFNSKLQSMGFELSDEGAASYTFDGQSQTSGTQSQRQPSSASKKPSSIYRLVSKKCTEEEKAAIQKSTSSLKKVQFKDHNTSTESDSSDGQRLLTDTDQLDDTEDDFDPQSEEMQSESQESFDDTYDSGSESSIPESYKSPTKRNTAAVPQNASPTKDFARRQPRFHSDDDDDISMSAFVPAEVRRQSLVPHGQQNDAESTCSESEASMDYARTTASAANNRYCDSDDDDCDREEMDALLDEAMDDLGDEVDMRNNPVPQPRKRKSHMYATTEGEVSLPDNEPVQMRAKSDGLAYSVSMYRNSRHTKITTHVDFEQHQEERPVSQYIYRKSQHVREDVVEEDIQMPTQLPPDVQRKTLHERIKELQDLVSQEQNVILQTSNALNKCCSGDSLFAGSAEQVECNRLLLISCQRRQAYLTECQRLKETGQLEAPNQQGPKGSLTISDIRLPLKKDFVTKIGTASDTTQHYFIILIRNGPQIISTQMLSTHDPLMRGSLDFPNLIKIHGISANFNINLEIYSMSISREQLKDKKKKTPKKPHKYGGHMPLESPGGPTAVRTTSFFLITSMPITMKCLDKSSFSLERIPYLSPLHGMIYLRLKCMMEQHVEERGFLTMFEDVSGLGSWHRRWCVLSGNKICFWKYPDDETKKDPMGYIDIKRVITEKVGLISRDICARPHTFELVSVRPPRRGEPDTLVTKTYNTMTTTRFMLSADTKEERIIWCNKVNRALANIRTWHADAMRPIRSSNK